MALRLDDKKAIVAEVNEAKRHWHSPGLRRRASRPSGCFVSPDRYPGRAAHGEIQTQQVSPSAQATHRREILARLEAGDIPYTEALARIRALRS